MSNQTTKANGNGKALRARLQARRWRTVHLVTGLVVGVWFILMALTGILVNHQTDWGLDQIEISNGYLPGHYTDEYHPESTRLNVVLTDLHSGRFFGSGGHYISDVIGLLVLISVGTGFYAYLLMRRANHLGTVSNRTGVEGASKPAGATRTPDSGADELPEKARQESFQVH